MVEFAAKGSALSSGGLDEASQAVGVSSPEIKRHGMADALKDHDCKAFARIYNGPNYAANNYDGHLEHFFRLYSCRI